MICKEIQVLKFFILLALGEDGVSFKTTLFVFFGSIAVGKDYEILQNLDCDSVSLKKIALQKTILVDGKKIFYEKYMVSGKFILFLKVVLSYKNWSLLNMLINYRNETISYI